MFFRWTHDNIKRFIKASKYTGFHENLAYELLPFLTKNDVVCDFGCGLGRLDLFLAPNVKELLALDISEEAIEALENELAINPIKNLKPQCVDTKEFSKKVDVGIMCFYGKRDENFMHYMSLCNKSLIRIVNMENNSSLYPSDYRKTVKSTTEEVKTQLEEQGLNFQFKKVELEFGQICENMADGRAFISSHGREVPEEIADEFIKERASFFEDGSFYIPNKKVLGIFVVDCSSIN